VVQRDPYGKLDQIPVAVVNEDRPVTVNGQEVNAGKLFVDELKKDRVFDWHFVDRAEAALDPILAWSVIGLVVLAAAAFTAIAHLFRTWLGGVASAVVLVLSLLQLTTCAGTYPYETLPDFFRALHWALPMAYFVDGLRVTITGGNIAHLWRDALVLAGFLVVALALTTLWSAANGSGRCRS
jgi:uncharacterized phage infection (PIP) family protein YhgE